METKKESETNRKELFEKGMQTISSICITVQNNRVMQENVATVLNQFLLDYFDSIDEKRFLNWLSSRIPISSSYLDKYLSTSLFISTNMYHWMKDEYILTHAAELYSEAGTKINPYSIVDKLKQIGVSMDETLRDVLNDDEKKKQVQQFRFINSVFNYVSFMKSMSVTEIRELNQKIISYIKAHKKKPEIKDYVILLKRSKRLKELNIPFELIEKQNEIDFEQTLNQLQTIFPSLRKEQ